MIVATRDKTIKLAKDRGDDWWGAACLAYGNVRQRLEAQNEHSWLRYLKEGGIGFTVLIGTVPIRLSREGVAKPVLGSERAQIGQLNLVFNELWRAADKQKGPKRFLVRMEFEALRWKPLERLCLKLVPENGEEAGSVVNDEKYGRVDTVREGASRTHRQFGEAGR